MFGHIEKDCRKKPKQAQAQISECDDEDHLFCAYHATQTLNDDVWLVDSGCSNHMTKNSSCFIGLDNSVRIPIRMGNGAIVQSDGKGTIAIETTKGRRLIKDVLYVPKLDKNLLTVPQMMKNGYSVHFVGNTCKILDPFDKEIAKVPMTSKSFPVKWSYSTYYAYKAESNETYWLWHRRLGHSNT